MTHEYIACCELECQFLDSDTLEGCIKRACTFTYVREREENAIDQARKDGKVKENL